VGKSQGWKQGKGEGLRVVGKGGRVKGGGERGRAKGRKRGKG
jgi:hypothetical protein